MLDNHGFDMWAGGYDQSVETSDESNAYPFAGYKKLMNSLYGSVMQQSPAKVLDVGIGTGTLATRLYEAGSEITGLDFSAEMLRQAGAKMPDARLLKADFSSGLPSELNDERFDFIISTYAIHHLEDSGKVKLIRELLNHLNEGGSILIGDVSFPDRDSLEACRKDSGGDWDADEHYFIFAEIEEPLREICEASYHPYSHCAGILEIKPSRAHYSRGYLKA